MLLGGEFADLQTVWTIRIGTRGPARQIGDIQEDVLAFHEVLVPILDRDGDRWAGEGTLGHRRGAAQIIRAAHENFVGATGGVQAIQRDLGTSRLLFKLEDENHA